MNGTSTRASPAAIYQRLEAGDARMARGAQMRFRQAPDMPACWPRLHRQKRYGEAIERYRRLTELAPGVVEHWSNLGTVLRESGDLGGRERPVATAPAPGTARSSRCACNPGLLQMG